MITYGYFFELVGMLFAKLDRATGRAACDPNTSGRV